MIEGMREQEFPRCFREKAAGVAFAKEIPWGEFS
jgi:hypothetical protein